jgi:tetratricopeptide (TPR) repeat protein
MKLISICFLLILSTLAYGQTVQFNYGGQISNYETGKKESGVTVTVMANGAKVASSVTASNGKYILKFDLPAQSVYDIVFSKPGFVSKKVSFDFKRLNTERIKDGEKLNPLDDLSLEIFTVKPGIDFSFLESEPVAKFNAESESTNLALDISASQRMKQKIEGLLDNSGKAVDDTDVKYNAALQEGEKLFKEEKLEAALKQFEAAAFLKPKEFLPQKRIAEIDKLLKAKKEETYAISETDQQYLNYIKAADNFRDEGKFTEAISKYRAAMRVKNEQYPKDEVAKIEKKINDQNASERVEKEYQAAITAGDAAMASKQFEVAVKQFTTATGLKSEEKYPKDQLVIAQKQLKDLAEAKEKQANYDAAMKEGSNLFAGSKFEEAKVKYEAAGLIFPNEAMPKERIKMCDDQLAKLAQSEKLAKEIDALFLEGQALIEKKDYTAAKGAYKKILGLDSKKNLAQVKLDEIDRLIKADEDAKNAEARFAKYVKLGDDAVRENDFASAKQQYGAALEVKQDATVQAKFDGVLAKIIDKDAKAMVATRYDEVINEAKKLLDNNELEKARLKYQNAASIDDSQMEPKLRIQEIDGRLSKKSAEDKRYREWIVKGDALVKEANYLEAIKMFNSASEMRPTEKEPREKAEEAARLSKDSETDANRLFEKMITAAKENIENSDYEKAKDLVNRAISFRPAEKRPEDRRPEDLLKSIEFLEKTEKSYQGFVASAEKEAEAKSYKSAIELYKKAAELRPKEEQPQKRIKELSELLNSQMGLAEIEKKYQENFSKGVSEMDIKSYKMALESFEKAQSFKPNDQATKDKISELKQLIEEKEKSLSNAADRKKLVESLVKEANLLFEKRDWSQAKSKYNQVVELDPGQPFSVARVIECDAKLQAEKDKLGELAYVELIANADKNFAEKDFLRSKDLFEKANGLKPADNYPVKKLAELERLLNPTIIKTSALEALGDVYVGEDADLDLAKAELERKNRKSDEFLKTKNSTIQQLEEQSAKMEARSYKTQANINIVENKASEQQILAEERNNNNVEQIKLIQYKAITKTEEEAAYDQAQNLSDQEKLNYIKSEIDAQSTIATEENQMKAIQMKAQVSSIQNSDEQRSMEYNQANINKAKQLSQISIEAQESMNDDESRRLTEAQLKLAKENATVATAELADNQTAKIQQNENKLSEFTSSNEARVEAYEANLEAKNLAIQTIQKDNMESSNDVYNREMEKHLQTKEQLNSQIKVSERKEEESNQDLRINQTKLESLKKKIASDQEVRERNDKDIEVHVQSNLDYIAIQKAEKQYEEDKKQNENVATIKKINSSAAEANAKLIADKQESSYTTQASINTVKNNASDASIESTEKQMKNAAAVKDMYVVESIRKEELADKATENQRALTEKIKKSAETPTYDKPKNTLGMDFPEGVTEEKFSQSGTDGTIHTIITRRVVVIDGHGDVYVRTQKNGVITYKKNNESITEYMWQKETQGSNLVRH